MKNGWFTKKLLGDLATIRNGFATLPKEVYAA